MQGSQLRTNALDEHVNNNILAYVTPQDLKTLEVEKLNPLSPEVISRQATINIGEQQQELEGSTTRGTAPRMVLHRSAACIRQAARSVTSTSFLRPAALPYQ
jgi:hypothetical protein